MSPTVAQRPPRVDRIVSRLEHDPRWRRRRAETHPATCLAAGLSIAYSGDYGPSMSTSQRVAFVFGSSVDAATWESADADEREQLVRERFAGGPPGASALRELAAKQLLDDEPPHVWRTAQRLAAQGLDAERVFGQLALAAGDVVSQLLRTQRPYDEDAYVARLDDLPLPLPEDIERTLLDIASTQVVIPGDELIARTIRQLGRDPDDEVVGSLIERVEERLSDDDGPLAWLPDDRTVHVARLIEGIVLTHVLSDAEREIGALTVSVDLAGFTRLEDPVVNSTPVESFSVERGHAAWAGPDGWLDGFDAGAGLAVRAGPDREIVIDELPAVPAIDDDLVAAVRAAYDEAVAEPELPVSCEELVLGVRAVDRAAFTAPQAPLGALCEAAGLQVSGGWVVHDPEIWTNQRHLARMHRIMDAEPDDSELVLRALDALQVADALATSEDPHVEVDTDRVRQALDALHEPAVWDVCTDELLAELHLSFDGDAGSRLGTVAAAFTAAADRPARRAVAHLVATLADELAGDVIVAEQHLELAVAGDRRFAPAVERLGWYAADRGDAVKAARLLRSVPLSSAGAQDLDMVASFTAAAQPGSAGLGRNDRCWCGSGRKYKHCHLGVPEQAPLADRVGWLCRKAVGYVERSGTPARAAVIDVVEAMTDGDLDEADPTDPLIMDLVLTEGGWFARFLDDRGPLLPDDEALLAASWVTVDRTVYEVVATRPGSDMVVRDLRTGDQMDVTEATLSRTAPVGSLLCGRAVPDGQRHQFIGGLFAVAPGTEAALLDLLDEGDPLAVAEWVADLRAPPRLRTREGEELVECEVVVRATDGAALRDHLDATYTADVPGRAYSEHHELDEDESVIRATLHVDDDEVTITTNSEERADRVLERLHAALDVTVVRDSRSPLDAADLMNPDSSVRAGLPDLRSLPGAADDDLDPAVIEAIRSKMELRWCDESVPALGDLTPRQAAADPTRREQLQRLLASFDAAPAPVGALTMRPDRLRAELGLA